MSFLSTSTVVAAANHDYKFHILVIIIAALAAFVPRYFPILFFTNRKLPEWFNEWMKYIPVSLFASLVAQRLFLDSYKVVTDKFTLFGHQLILYGHLDHIIAGLFVLLIAYFTRSMVLSVVLGLILVFIFASFI